MIPALFLRKELNNLLFYDFEVFKHDWLVVIADTNTKNFHVIVNDVQELTDFHTRHIKEIWVGWNSRHYDQYILKGILCGFDPKKINDFIIIEGRKGWEYSNLFNKIPLNNYDAKRGLDPSLKVLEGYMGNSVVESSVPFDIDRPLTREELENTIAYCKNDVKELMNVFIERKDDFDAHLGLVNMICEGKALDLSLLGKTAPQLSAILLKATKRQWNDEFDVDLPPTLQLSKYKHIADWYLQDENRCYIKDGKKNQLEVDVAGVPHVFGYGGVHGAREKFSARGYFINMDVASLYPSLMIVYNLLSRTTTLINKYKEIYDRRLQLKAEKNPLEQVLKLFLNSVYGVMKDVYNALYDPRQSNRVCIYGQMLLLDLIEKLEPHAILIQSNTDGVLIQMPAGENPDAWFSKIDDIAYEWESRTGLNLDFKEHVGIYQKDVNNYVIVNADGTYKSKGAWVKKPKKLDNDLPIVKRALVDYFVNGTYPEVTIKNAKDLIDFQLMSRATVAYSGLYHGDELLNEKCVRTFASKNTKDKGLYKCSKRTGKLEKVENTPLNCFFVNGAMDGVKVPKKLNLDWYIDLAYERIEKFGVELTCMNIIAAM